VPAVDDGAEHVGGVLEGIAVKEREIRILAGDE
jgi:hypothetical protein